MKTEPFEWYSEPFKKSNGTVFMHSLSLLKSITYKIEKSKLYHCTAKKRFFIPQHFYDFEASATRWLWHSIKKRLNRYSGTVFLQDECFEWFTTVPITVPFKKSAVQSRRRTVQWINS